MGIRQFGIPRDLTLWLKDALRLRAFVETGTNKAETTVWASEHFPKVVTIEGQASLYSAAVAKHTSRRNIKFINGDSRTQLGPALDELGEPAVLWLDAHWCGEGTFGPSSECPLLEELEAVNRSSPDHVVLVDDARFFTSPPRPPHKVGDWPDLLQIARALTEGKVPRYGLIYEDVIVAVPLAARDELVSFVHRAEAPKSPPAAGLPERIARGLWRRSVNALRGPMQKRHARGDA
jgi:hypothetical protein